MSYILRSQADKLNAIVRPNSSARVVIERYTVSGSTSANSGLWHTALAVTEYLIGCGSKRYLLCVIRKQPGMIPDGQYFSAQLSVITLWRPLEVIATTLKIKYSLWGRARQQEWKASNGRSSERRDTACKKHPSIGEKVTMSSETHHQLKQQLIQQAHGLHTACLRLLCQVFWLWKVTRKIMERFLY